MSTTTSPESSYMHQRMARTVERDELIPGAIRSFPELTPTERFVAIAIARGAGPTPRDRAAMLKMSRGTYASHRDRILEKLEVKNDVQLALLAVRRGFVKP